MNDMSNTNKKKDLGMYEEESKAMYQEESKGMYQEESKATEAKTTRGYRGKDNPRSSVTTGPMCQHQQLGLRVSGAERRPKPQHTPATTSASFPQPLTAFLASNRHSPQAKKANR